MRYRPSCHARCETSVSAHQFLLGLETQWRRDQEAQASSTTKFRNSMSRFLLIHWPLLADRVSIHSEKLPVVNCFLSTFLGYKETTVIRCLLAESVTSAVGLKEALLSHNFAIRFIWSLLFLSGALSTAYFMYKTTSEYLDEPTATKVSFPTTPRATLSKKLFC